MATEMLRKTDFDKVCRICLQTEFTNIFMVNEPEIFQMFQYCTTIAINIMDGLPNQICQNCFLRLTDAFQFKQLCENSHRVLLEIRDDDTKEAIELINNVVVKQEFDEHADTDVKPSLSNDFESENDDFRGEDDDDGSCEDQCLSERIVNSKTSRSQLDPDKCDPKTLTCKSCNKVLSTVRSLKRHLRTHEDRKYRCDVCNKGFHEKRQLTSHMKRHDNDTKYKCEFCDLQFFDLNTLCAHVSKSHDPEPVTCTVCNKKFVIQLKLDSHMKVHSTEKDHICSVCGKGFYKRYLLCKHQKHHATERSYHCLQCDKSFKADATLRLHYKRCHSGEKMKREVCTICGKSVLNIKAHLNTHNNDQVFKCPECPKEFSNKYNVEEHRKRKHGNPLESIKRPYLCSICGKGSVSTTALKIHFEHIHTVGKPYSCPICNKKFKTEKAVNVHVRLTHNGERRYTCTVCTKTFQTNTILKIHMRIHTGERPFPCKLCSKAFAQRGALQSHMKVHGLEKEKVDKSEVIDESHVMIVNNPMRTDLSATTTTTTTNENQKAITENVQRFVINL